MEQINEISEQSLLILLSIIKNKIHPSEILEKINPSLRTSYENRALHFNPNKISENLNKIKNT